MYYCYFVSNIFVAFASHWFSRDLFLNLLSQKGHLLNVWSSVLKDTFCFYVKSLDSLGILQSRFGGWVQGLVQGNTCTS